MREVTPAKTLQQLAKIWDVEADYDAELARYVWGRKERRRGAPNHHLPPSSSLSLVLRIVLVWIGIRRDLPVAMSRNMFSVHAGAACFGSG